MRFFKALRTAPDVKRWIKNGGVMDKAQRAVAGAETAVSEAFDHWFDKCCCL